MMRNELSEAEKLLQSFGVTTPEEIDLEAIAHFQGVKVRYSYLEGCEARILANGDRGIMRVNLLTKPERRRFSIAHELGHWKYDRGKGAICTAQDIFGGNRASKSREAVANKFASKLILPPYLLKEQLRGRPRLTWKLVDEIALLYRTSLHATVLALVELNIVPAMFTRYAQSGRQSFTASKDVPQRWFPQEQLSQDSEAFDCLFGGVAATRKTRTSASFWFDRYEADRYELEEESVKGFGDEVWTILNLTDENMLEDR